MSVVWFRQWVVDNLYKNEKLSGEFLGSFLLLVIFAKERTINVSYKLTSKPMNKRAIAVVGVLAVLVIGLTVYWQFFGSRPDGINQSAQVIDSQNQGSDEDAQIITALHQFSNGRHTIAGEVDLPTPCHMLNQEVSVSGTAPNELITIAFVTTSQDQTLCAQVLKSTRYKIDFMASETAQIRATWNGVPAILNLVPVSSEESLDSFEVFIKG